MLNLRYCLSSLCGQSGIDLYNQLVSDSIPMNKAQFEWVLDNIQHNSKESILAYSQFIVFCYVKQVVPCV